MSTISTGLVSPRYRHFVPTAPALQVAVPSLKRTSMSSGLKAVRVHATVQIANERTYILPEYFRGSTTGIINLYVNSVFVSNRYGFFGQTIPVYDEFGNPMIDPDTNLPVTTTLMEFERFTYNTETNSVTLTKNMTTLAAGTQIRFETIVGSAIQENNTISMKQYLIQGAAPLDLSIVNPQDPTALFFQGGYRCNLWIMTNPKHGVAKISDDRLNLEYRPEVGFYGTDYFSYRLINIMGQESEVACITITVGG